MKQMMTQKCRGKTGLFLAAVLCFSAAILPVQAQATEDGRPESGEDGSEWIVYQQTVPDSEDSFFSELDKDARVLPVEGGYLTGEGTVEVLSLDGPDTVTEILDIQNDEDSISVAEFQERMKEQASAETECILPVNIRRTDLRTLFYARNRAGAERFSRQHYGIYRSQPDGSLFTMLSWF